VKIYWRSKEGQSPPPNAQFSRFPFAGKKEPLNSVLVETLPAPCSKWPILRRIDQPNRTEWKRLVEQAVAHIRTGALQKVVLARETTLHFASAPDPFQLTAALRSEGAALFCVQEADGKAFFGATPERLFRRQDGSILVEAVAGTRKLGDALEQELLSSAKDLREFQFVQDYLQKELPSLSFSPIRVHKTANVQHLFSQGVGPWAFNDPTALIESLHPTPALCGTPKEPALAWIQANEPFSRGLYGGVIGWEWGDKAEWMVTIRSCFLEGLTAQLYVGTGIVEGSDPELEWQELEAKLSLYAPLFEGLS